jgi:hypothetical protein
MKIEISDEALKNDKQGTIASFLNFIEKVYTNCPAYIKEDPNFWVVVQEGTGDLLSKITFDKKKYTAEQAIEIFNEIVYGK